MNRCLRIFCENLNWNYQGKEKKLTGLSHMEGNFPSNFFFQIFLSTNCALNHINFQLSTKSTTVFFPTPKIAKFHIYFIVRQKLRIIWFMVLTLPTICLIHSHQLHLWQCAEDGRKKTVLQLALLPKMFEIKCWIEWF